MSPLPTAEPPTPSGEPPAPLPHRPKQGGLKVFLASFRYAFAGLGYLIATQRNAQIHCLAAVCAVLLGLLVHLERWEWLILTLTITLVLAAEGVNTAIEAVVDLSTSVYHPLAKIAKDVAAGTVLICAIGALLVGLLLFLPHLWSLFGLIL